MQTSKANHASYPIRGIVLFAALLCMTNYCNKVFAENASKPSSFWETYSRWYEWKLGTDLSPSQRQVIEYLEVASPLIQKARYTMSYSPTSLFRRLHAIYSKRQVRRYRQKFSVLNPPVEAREFHQAGNELFSAILAYHELLERTQNREQAEKAPIEFMVNLGKIEGRLFGSFFATLRDAGLFDKLDQEMEALAMEKGPPKHMGDGTCQQF